MLLQYLPYLVFIGAFVQILGSTTYIVNTLKGKTKPNRVTFFFWALAPMIAVAAAISDGVGWAILPVFLVGFGPLLTFLASFVNPNAYWQLRRFDYLCGLFALLALILWAITKEPLVAIIFAILSDGFAAFPTLIKSWKFPETETAAAYATALFGSITGFFAIQTGALSEYIFGIYLVVMNLALVLILYRRKIFPKLFAVKYLN